MIYIERYLLEAAETKDIIMGVECELFLKEGVAQGHKIQIDNTGGIFDGSNWREVDYALIEFYEKGVCKEGYCD